jgi:hypothetical protein
LQQEKKKSSNLTSPPRSPESDYLVTQSTQRTCKPCSDRKPDDDSFFFQVSSPTRTDVPLKYEGANGGAAAAGSSIAVGSMPTPTQLPLSAMLSSVSTVTQVSSAQDEPVLSAAAANRPEEKPATKKSSSSSSSGAKDVDSQETKRRRKAPSPLLHNGDDLNNEHLRSLHQAVENSRVENLSVEVEIEEGGPSFLEVDSPNRA